MCYMLQVFRPVLVRAVQQPDMVAVLCCRKGFGDVNDVVGQLVAVLRELGPVGVLSRC